jgi:cupin fold WbuC family metalloprotein
LAIRAFCRADLDALVGASQLAPRRRLNLNVHRTADDPCQRLFNAVEPESYIRPHRHAHPALAETMVAIRGAFLLVEFADDGGISDSVALAAPGSPRHAEAAVVVELAPGTWHTVVALEPGSIFFETKAGPYDPNAPRDFAPWAPEEGAPGAAAWWQALRTRVAARPG